MQLHMANIAFGRRGRSQRAAAATATALLSEQSRYATRPLSNDTNLPFCVVLQFAETPKH